MDDPLDRPLTPVLGGRTAKRLESAFEMRTFRDLLWHFPRRYSNRGELTPLVGLPVGEHVSVLAQVLDARERRMQRRRGTILELTITDGIGTLKLTFFNQPWRSRELLPGTRGIFAGKVSEYRGRLQLQNPDYQLFDGKGGRVASSRPDDIDGTPERASSQELSLEKSMELDEAEARAFAERPVPIYPATAQVPSWTIEDAVTLVLDALPEPLADPIPAELRSQEGVFAFDIALRLIHKPERTADWQRARDSMRFREAFELQLGLLDRRRRSELTESRPRPAVEGGLLDRFDAILPFELTGDQRRVGERIAAELSRPHPMHRLLQGEVGSGKTVVALRAMLQVADGEGQSAMLAPTEVLASQHFRSVVEILGPELVEAVRPVLLTGRMPAAERRRALLAVASGQSRIVVGTHALLGDEVTFVDLGLVVVDEQHRFGVEQREVLRRKGAQPHVLAMTATPIPRTVALTAFGDLEVSTIRELPAGRQGIETFVVPELEMPKREARVWARAAEDIAAGRQVYVVCPAIAPGADEEGETAEQLAAPGETGAGSAESGARSDARSGAEAQKRLANVEETVAELRARPEFAGLRIEALTGAMKPAEKDAAMEAFAAGRAQILVATTVVEVGVNVPNASIMIVRDADRFGISQLHQLRGRVGRGEHPGLCLLITRAEQGSVARERLDAVAATTDGFVLAEADLELRREGDILGTAQSGGRSTLRLLRVAEHGELIARARELAAGLLAEDPELASAPGLAAVLAREREARQLDNLAKS